MKDGAVSVARRLRDAGFEAYFAGGCVRDLLLGRTPKDFDIATDATPTQVQGLFRRTVLVGAAFGVIRVRVADGQEYEVATYRTDGTYTDGRRPDAVSYSKDKQEDVARRDFTINALLMDPFTDEILDYVGGRTDLGRGLIRAVGDAERRFFEDKLRMLRAVRFASRFGFGIEASTQAAIQKHASSIVLVSAERIVAELHAMWSGPGPSAGMELLGALGLFSPIFSFVPGEALGELLPDFGRLGAALNFVERALAAGPDPEAAATLGWSLVLSRRDERHQVDGVLRSMKLSQKLMRDVRRVLELEPSLFDPSTMRQADRVRLLREKVAPLALAHLAARRGMDDPGLDLLLREHRQALADALPTEPWVGGNDLMRLGLTPSPRFKEILWAVETEILERRIHTKEEALALAAKLASA
ncbi:MAG: CCA tRNA nucleotidyltransferase [Myxococcota bacterium]